MAPKKQMKPRPDKKIDTTPVGRIGTSITRTETPTQRRRKNNSGRLEWDIDTSLTKTHASPPPNHHHELVTTLHRHPPPSERQSHQDENALITTCVVVDDDIPHQVAHY
jgi:hypothetical protein